MELTHEFTVPAPIEETWRALNDIEGVAGCFPGAKVTSVEGDSFQGTCKVKLGPIALTYAGSGEFTGKDESAHTMTLAAKGKDKRGNGTAGANATLSMSATDDGTAVEIHTDLSITGKPAQFGRGVIQDVSDKLLGQFVACLEEKSRASPTEAPAQAAAVEEPSGTEAAGPSEPSEPESGTAGASAAYAPPPTTAAGPTAAAGPDDALDLGATVLPVLVKSYGKQLAAGLGAILALLFVVRLVRRR